MPNQDSYSRRASIVAAAWATHRPGIPMPAGEAALAEALGRVADEISDPGMGIVLSRARPSTDEEAVEMLLSGRRQGILAPNALAYGLVDVLLSPEVAANVLASAGTHRVRGDGPVGAS